MPGLVHVVDDDASFRTAIERRLKHAGYEVETYSSAQHLLDRQPGVERPGCILLDVQMPGLSGLELQDRLIELGSILPILRSAYVRPLAWKPALVSQLASLPVWKFTTDPLVANPNGLLPALWMYFEPEVNTMELGAPVELLLPLPNGLLVDG